MFSEHYPINEANINRIMWHGRHGFIIISGSRSSIKAEWNPDIDLTDQYNEWLRKEGSENTKENRNLWLKTRNRKSEESLLNDIKNSHYAYTKVYGGYHNGSAVDSYEPSFIVYNHDRSHSNNEKNWEDLYKFAINMCAKYDQDTVYIQAPNEAPVYVDKDGNIVSKRSSKDFKINRDDETYFTTTKRDKTNPQRFTADIQFESLFRATPPSTYVDRIRRTQGGEVIMDD